MEQCDLHSEVACFYSGSIPGRRKVSIHCSIAYSILDTTSPTTSRLRVNALPMYGSSPSFQFLNKYYVVTFRRHHVPLLVWPQLLSYHRPCHPLQKKIINGISLRFVDMMLPCSEEDLFELAPPPDLCRVS